MRRMSLLLVGGAKSIILKLMRTKDVEVRCLSARPGVPAAAESLEETDCHLTGRSISPAMEEEGRNGGSGGGSGTETREVHPSDSSVAAAAAERGGRTAQLARERETGQLCLLSGLLLLSAFPGDPPGSQGQ